MAQIVCLTPAVQCCFFNYLPPHPKTTISVQTCCIMLKRDAKKIGTYEKNELLKQNVINKMKTIQKLSNVAVRHQ